MKSLTDILERFHGDQRGAILLLSLAAVLILMLMAWVAFDAGPAARDKLELQGAADTAAYSQSAVRARSANYIAYANVAKRSIVAITALYPSMMVAFDIWLAAQAADCFKWLPNPSACANFFANAPMWVVETLGDATNFAGFTAAVLWITTFGLLGSPGGNVTNYYREDLEALDNLQRYLFNLAGWWGWSEGVVRGMRNGATSTGSFPVPRGRALRGFPDIVTLINRALGAASINSTDNYPTTNLVDQLPFRKGEWDFDHFTTTAALAETAVNVLNHRNESDLGAKKMVVIAMGTALYFLRGWKMMAKEYGRVSDPFLFAHFSDEGKWLTMNSTLVFAYLNRPDKFTKDRQKFSVPSADYKFRLGLVDEFTYRSSGSWSMARAEISFQGGSPHPFQAGWTARLRPVSLPGEWFEAGYSMNQAYHDVLPYMALASLVGAGDFNYILRSIWDFAAMERTTRGFGPSTIGGFPK